MGEALKAQAASTNATLEAAQAEAQGIQARNAAYAEAYRLESDSASMLEIAGENLMRMQLNKSLQLGQLRAEQAGQGFALTGSKRSAETSLASVIDQAIADTVRSAATQDAYARTQANMLRKEGDMQQHMGSITSQYKKKVAQANQTAMPWLWIGESLYTGAKIFK
jgi:uncharacterized Zn finger protein